MASQQINIPKFLDEFIRCCSDAYARGWHEANGGNLSYRLDAKDAQTLEQNDLSSWQLLSQSFSSLAGAKVLITASGAHMRNIANDLEANAGIIEIDDVGAAWRKVWGFIGDAQPSSELETHLAIYANDPAQENSHQLDSNRKTTRVVYHAHCPHVIALSTLIAPDSRMWTRTLWQTMTEGIIVFPEGIAAIPWMVPGSRELADATSECMRISQACVWAQHGLIVRASGFDDAFGIVDTIEKTAGIYLEARAANGGDVPAYLVKDNELRAICKRYDLQPNEEYLA